MRNRFIGEVLSNILDPERYDRNAFYINKRFYTYRDLVSVASQIIPVVDTIEADTVCLYANNDIRVYAAIVALWSCGKAYVPLNPQQPVERHREVARSVSADHVLCADVKYEIGLDGVEMLDISQVEPTESPAVINVRETDDDSLAYIIFTSGSTGKPKGVPITRGNLAAFVESMDNIGLDITEEDRCLQPFDLTFDFSVSSYVIPLVKGACTYTVPAKGVKFLHIAALIEDHHLTVLQMVPSMMRNLLPYIDELNLSSVRYNIFCGEALMAPAVTKWHGANESMVSYNMYGPTEDTVFCTYYLIDKSNVDRIVASHDIVCIGGEFKNCGVLLADEGDNIITDSGIEGELCLSGDQLTPGYWKNPDENAKKFMMIDGVRYYRTGDLCYYGENRNLMFVGRKDFQVKVNGFRVELGEIEKIFTDASEGRFCVAMPYQNEQGNTELALVIEGKEYDCSFEKEQMLAKLPKYEIPSAWRFVRNIPLNQNGKVDRGALKSQLGF